MKSLLKLLAMVLVVPLFFISCDDDSNDPKTVNVLIIVDRAGGTVSTVNTETGALTNITTFSFNSTDLTNIRSLAYNEITEMLYAGQNNNGGGQLFEIDPATKVATLINDNDDGTGTMEWYGLADIHVVANGDLKLTTWDFALDEPVITTITTAGIRTGTVQLVDPGEGLALTMSGSNYLVGDRGQFYEVDNTGATVNTTALSGSFSPAITIADTYVQNFTWIDDVLYTLIYDDNSGNTFVATLDPTTGELTQLSGALASRHHGLTSLPEDAL